MIVLTMLVSQLAGMSTVNNCADPPTACNICSLYIFTVIRLKLAHIANRIVSLLLTFIVCNTFSLLIPMQANIPIKCVLINTGKALYVVISCCCTCSYCSVAGQGPSTIDSSSPRIRRYRELYEGPIGWDEDDDFDTAGMCVR